MCSATLCIESVSGKDSAPVAGLAVTFYVKHVDGASADGRGVVPLEHERRRQQRLVMVLLCR